MNFYRNFAKSLIWCLEIFFMSILVPYDTNAQVSVFQSISTSDGLPSNYVFQLDEDENGLLWAATDKGLAFYNGLKWQNYDTDNLLPGNYVNQIICSGKGGLWLTISSKGFFYFDFKNQTITKISEEYVGGLVVDKEGTLYYTKESKNGRINYYIKADKPTRSVVNYKNKNNQGKNLPQFLKIKNISAKLIADSIYSSGSYLYKIKADGGIAIKQFFDPGNKGFHITSTGDGYWVADNSTKVFFTTKEFTKSIEYNFANGLLTPLISTIYVSDNNQTLICTMGAGIQVLLPEGNLKIATNNSAIAGIAIEKNLVYAVSEKHLYIINILLDTLLHKFNLPDKQIMNINIIGGQIYISSLFGYSVYKISGNQLIRKEFVELGAGISAVLNVNHKLITSSYGSGIIEAATLKKKEKETPLMSRHPVMERMQNLQTGFTAYNYEDGIYFFDKEYQEIACLNTTKGLLSNNVSHVMEDDNTMWISTAKGISIVKNFQVVRSLPVKFPNSTDKCIFSFKDNSNRIWMVSNKGLWRFSGEKFIQTHNTILLENKNDQIIEAAFNPATNSLVTGTNQQLFLIDMGKINFDSTVQKPNILQASADGIELNPALLNRFSYNTDVLSFSFKPYFNKNFTESRIYFKLKGLNDDYQQLSDSLNLQFSKLRPGNYTLFAKSVNADGFESDSTILTHFKIEKPFWQMWWFGTLLLSASVLITYFITVRISKKRQDLLKKEKKMAEQLVVERERISRELHDNLGANLVTMIAQTDNIETNLINNKPEEALKKTRQLSNHSRETVNILRETIWAVQENEHSLEDFLLRVKNYLQRTLPVKNIDWVATSTGILTKNLSATQTLNLFRIIQETTQNICKHSGADLATYKFIGHLNQLTIIITDNGPGFDAGRTYWNNGLKNIIGRTDDLGGKVTFSRTENSGTTITITITSETA